MHIKNRLFLNGECICWTLSPVGTAEVAKDLRGGRVQILKASGPSTISFPHHILTQTLPSLHHPQLFSSLPRYAAQAKTQACKCKNNSIKSKPQHTTKQKHTCLWRHRSEISSLPRYWTAHWVLQELHWSTHLLENLQANSQQGSPPSPQQGEESKTQQLELDASTMRAKGVKLKYVLQQ